MSKKSMKQKVGMGLALTGLAACAGATAVALMKKKKREEIYHEAELKAMNELDELMAEAEQGADCAACAQDCVMNLQDEDSGEPEEVSEADEEQPEEPIEDSEPTE